MNHSISEEDKGQYPPNHYLVEDKQIRTVQPLHKLKVSSLYTTQVSICRSPPLTHYLGYAHKCSPIR